MIRISEKRKPQSRGSVDFSAPSPPLRTLANYFLMLGQSPFVIRGFHSDNGGEFISQMVARLLEELSIKQTKSRAHRSGDTRLVESKNGALAVPFFS